MKTYLINLKIRPDRLESAKAQLDGLIEYEVFPAIQCMDGSKGIYLTLYSLIEKAYFSGENRIIIFEDDIKILDSRRLLNIINQFDIQTDFFDIFYLGCNTHDPNEGRTPLAKHDQYHDVFKVLDAYGCHAMVLTRSGMFKILKAINKASETYIRDLIPHPSSWSKPLTYKMEKHIEDTRPIDMLIQQEIQPDCRCYCCNPILVTQASGYSDIQNKHMNQDYIVDRFNANVDILLSK